MKGLLMIQKSHTGFSVIRWKSSPRLALCSFLSYEDHHWCWFHFGKNILWISRCVICPLKPGDRQCFKPEDLQPISKMTTVFHKPQTAPSIHFIIFSVLCSWLPEIILTQTCPQSSVQLCRPMYGGVLCPWGLRACCSHHPSLGGPDEVDVCLQQGHHIFQSHELFVQF